MILVRNVFRLKFGKAKDAVAIWKEGLEVMKRVGGGPPGRILTDLTGPSYTLVFENTYESLAAFEQAMRTVMSADEWRAWYQRFVPLAESSHREIYTIVA